MEQIKKLLIVFLLICGAGSLFAENEFIFSAAPAYVSPLGMENLRGGIGGTASLDWSFWQFGGGGAKTKPFGLGLSAGGFFSNFSVIDGSAFPLYEGGLGLFVRWRPFDRWTFRLDSRVGAYNFSYKESGGNRIMAGLSLGADFHLSPYIALFAQGGFTYRVFAEGRPLNSIAAVLGARLNLTEIMTGRARIQTEKTGQQRIFPVSFAWYGENPVATVQITNNEPASVTGVNLSFFMDNYMGRPVSFAVLPRLASGESVSVPVTALFNETMLTLTENVNANSQIQIQYRSLGAKKEAVFSLQMPIFHRNAMSWDDDRRAASFVSSRDSAARHFARSVASQADRYLMTQPRQTAQPRNVQYAVALFEALRLYGINYIIDPASSFIEKSEDASALDDLYYPYQTLNYRGGDCDDLSILYCSLLEVLGVETAFLTIPGHIYMAFDIGDDGWAAGNGDIIEEQGRRWMPVEITIPSEGFTVAWRVGGREWRNAGKNGNLFPMRESWKLYPPVSVAESGSHLPEVPAAAQITAALDRQLRSLPAASPSDGGLEMLLKR
jgi:hypothetical protein